MSKQIKAIINGIEETLTGFEAELYLKQGEKAVINRRAYLNQSEDFFKSTYKEKATSQYTPRNTKDTVTYGIEEDEY